MIDCGYKGKEKVELIFIDIKRLWTLLSSIYEYMIRYVAV